MFARRRSGAYRTVAAHSPKASAVARRVTGPRPLSTPLAEPLPTSLATGRHSTLGHVGCPTLNKTNCATPSGIPIGKRPPTRPPSTSSIGSVTTQRPTATASRPLGGASRAKPVARAAAPVASRKPSELDVLKAKIAQLENDVAQKDETLSVLRDVTEMLKATNETIKTQSEALAVQRDSYKSQAEALGEQSKSWKTSYEQEKALNAELNEQINEKESAMRKLHNDVVDLRGQIRVAVRVRPLLKSEDATSDSAVEFPEVNSIIINQGSKSTGAVSFEKVFTPVFTQSQVFVEIEDFIMSALHGYNVGLIAFGQTGSGKTHTMRGGEEENEGIIPRAASFLFKESKKLEAFGWKFEFSLSFLEIYNNEAYDLLKNRDAIKLRLGKESVALDGLSEHPLKKQSDMSALLRKADGNRKTAATKCNEYSSRSHAIYMWNIKAHQESTGISTTSVLKLVDLAGSERAKESGVTGQQFKEMTNINQSLSVLQKCISLQKSKSAHVPYRESKLTQVLMDCLGRGNSKTMVVVNINPCNEQATESKRSIEFAAKMRDTHIGSAVQQRDL